MASISNWNEHARLVLTELKKSDTRLGNLETMITDIKVELGKLTESDKQQKTIDARLGKLEIDVATHKVRSGMWGAASGALITIAAWLTGLTK